MLVTLISLRHCLGYCLVWGVIMLWTPPSPATVPSTWTTQHSYSLVSCRLSVIMCAITTLLSI